MTEHHPGHPPAVGRLATEAGLLLDALSVRLAAAQAGRTASDGRPAGPSPSACPECGHAPANEAATCTGCPICRLLTVLRGERPEVTGALVEAAALLVTALRALWPEPATGPAGTPPPVPDEPSPAVPEGTAGVQRIPIQ